MLQNTREDYQSALSFGFLLICALCTGAQADDSPLDLKHRFLAEYPAAVEAMKGHFALSEGRVVQHTTYEGVPSISKMTRKYSFVRQKQGMKIFIEPGPPDKRLPFLICYNPDYRFKIAKTTDGQYSLQDLEDRKSNDDGLVYSFLQIYLEAPCRAGNARLASLMTRPDFVLKNVTAVTDNGKALLKVEFEAPQSDHPRNHGRGFIGWILLSPDENWATYEYEIRPRNGTAVWSGTIQYAGMQENFPVPLRVVNINRVTTNKKMVIRDVFEFDHIDFSPNLSDDQFRLSAYGLPEAMAVPRPVRTYGVGWWLVGLAVGSLALALVLLRLSMIRSRKARASSSINSGEADAAQKPN